MRSLSQFLLKLFGWKIVGTLPKENKYLIVVAPHTSNWDLLVGLVGRISFGVKVSFLMKKQVFVFPLGPIMRALGGIAVDRSKNTNLVDQIARQFQERDKLILALTPEGTRSPVKRWKQGFYHIACKAKIPLLLVGFDYPSKEIRISELFQVTGDIEQDFPKIIAYFKGISGKYPKEIPY